jgi:predicted esterase YcpF (UPF0227 family)
MLYYIHGYQSNPNSNKGTLFQEKLNVIPIKYRYCQPEDIVISECLLRIENEIADDDNAILIGSSLGGLLAAKTALNNSNINQLILLNPAIIPPSVDISKIQGIPQRILADMQDDKLFEKKIDSKIFIFVGIMDNVIPIRWMLEFAKSQEATVRFFHDDHSFTYNLKNLPDIISNLIDEKH